MNLIRNCAALALACAVSLNSAAADSTEVSVEQRLGLAAQAIQLAEAAAHRDPLERCILRTKNNCTSNTNCDPGEECRKNTNVLSPLHCSCYPKKKDSADIGGLQVD